MITFHVVPIVEGETEKGCIKLLLSRLWQELVHASGEIALAVTDAFVSSRSALVHAGHPGLDDQIVLASRRLANRAQWSAANRGMVLLLIDADEDCPARLGPALLRRAQAARSDIDIACVLAKREFENWFKAAAASLSGVGKLPDDLAVPPNPEEGSGDAWLTQQMRGRNQKSEYKKPKDAVELVRRMDLQQCRDDSPSFDKLCRELELRSRRLSVPSTEADPPDPPASNNGASPP